VARPKPLDWLMLLALTVMWGSAFLMTKVALESLPPPLVVAARMAVASAVLLALGLLWLRRLPTGRRTWMFFVLIAFFGNALPFSLISWGQDYIDSGLAGILMAAMPLFTLSLAHFFVPGERMTLFRALGFMLGFIGVVVLMGPGSLPGLAAVDKTFVPMLAVLAGAASYAVSAILSRLRPEGDAFGAALATTLLATLMVVPAGFYNGELSSTLQGNTLALAAVAGLGIFSTAMAAVMYFRLVTRAGPGFVSQLNYLIPVWAVAIGAVFLGEQPQLNHLYALALILGGILVTQLQWTKLRRTAESNEIP
jgi:drug/metabolite transporter (DMT)-like permease